MRKVFSSYMNTALVAVMMFTVSFFSFAEQHGQSRQEADVTRNVAPPYYEGIFELEPRIVGEEIKLCPVLKTKDGKTYRLRPSSSPTEERSCKEAIDNCKEGDRCVVKGVVGSGGDLFANEVTSFSKGEKAPAVKAEQLTKKTTSGAEFKRASEEDLRAAGIKDTKKFGEAWRDPSGMVWGDIAKEEDGSPLYMNYKDAEAYCKSLGAELPSGWQEDLNGKHDFPNRDSDFVRLRKYMGAEYAAKDANPERYRAEILPNFDGWHWSSSVHPFDTNDAYVFIGRDGNVGNYYRYRPYYCRVRCVVRAARVDG